MRGEPAERFSLANCEKGCVVSMEVAGAIVLKEIFVEILMMLFSPCCVQAASSQTGITLAKDRHVPMEHVRKLFLLLFLLLDFLGGVGNITSAFVPWFNPLAGACEPLKGFFYCSVKGNCFICCSDQSFMHLISCVNFGMQECGFSGLYLKLYQVCLCRGLFGSWLVLLATEKIN